MFFTLMVGAPRPSTPAPHGSRMGTGGGHYRRYRQHPPEGLPSTSSTSVVAATGPVASTPRGAAFDIFNFDGERCRTSRQHPPGGPPSTSSTSVMAATGSTASSPRGVPSTSSTSMVVAAGPAASTPKGGRQRRLQLWYWPLSNLPPAPHRGPAIDVSNFWTSSSGTSRGPIVNVS
jgi:hypothetical protein